jgi:ubiquinone/menaquinone biosynthesis C-methylase UbiE
MPSVPLRPVAQHRWQSYDSVAAEYDRVWRPAFEPIARDLVELVGLSSGATVLDVGTGTGVAAIEAAHELHGEGAVVGIDPSARMLRHAGTRAPVALVASETPGLPFTGRAFDAVLANLVLSHFDRPDTALIDMVRVLQPGGRLGVTAWGSLDDEPVDDNAQREFTEIWRTLAERFVDIDADDIEAAIPWEEWFADPAHLRGALEGNGLRAVALHGRTYRREVTQRDMLTGCETSFRGRYVRNQLGDAERQRFHHDVAKTARAALPDPITRVDQLLIATGTKPFEHHP